MRDVCMLTVSSSFIGAREVDAFIRIPPGSEIIYEKKERGRFKENYGNFLGFARRRLLRV